jgi:hypothetical protein
MSISSHQFLSIYTWFGLSALLLLMALIARFYERLSNQPTYYRWFAFPILTWGGATIRQVHLDQLTGDPWMDLLLLVSGLSLAALCLNLYQLMTSAPKAGGVAPQPSWVQRLLRHLKPETKHKTTKT